MFGFVFMAIWLGIMWYVIKKVMFGSKTGNSIRYVNGQIVNSSAGDIDIEATMLKEVIDNTLKKYQKENIDKQYTPKMTGKVLLMYVISALITILVISYLCLYHNNFFVAILIEAINIFITIKVIRKVNIRAEIIKSIKASPDDNMEYIIAGIINNADESKTKLTKTLGLIVSSLSLIIPLIAFAKPHMIYEYDSANDGYAIRYYSFGLITRDSKVTIPDTYKDKPVTGIRGNVFINLIYITDLEMNNNMVEIRGHAFENTNIKSVTLPDTLKLIGGYAFASTRLKEVIIPDSVTEIEGGAFSECHNLERVILSKNITEVHGNTFENTRISEIVIPTGVTRIGGHAFYGCSSLSSVTVPSTVQEIGSSAFRESSTLKYISIPKGTTVDTRAFKESPTQVSRY